MLRSGALPAPLRKTFETQVGPTMGRDSVDKAKLSMYIGAAAVILFMLIYYRLSGLIAIVAMVLNMLYMLAILAGFEASLTLPGIAGLVLTVGMAVDANIIIYERIREELRLGKSRAHRGRRGLRARVLDGVRRARDQLRRRRRALLLRLGPDPRLRGHAAGRHHHQPVHLVLVVALDVRRGRRTSRARPRPRCRSKRHETMAARTRTRSSSRSSSRASNYEFIGRHEVLDRPVDRADG